MVLVLLRNKINVMILKYRNYVASAAESMQRKIVLRNEPWKVTTAL
jgi:hypothetical protein